MSTLNRDRLLNWAKTVRHLHLMETSLSRQSLSRAASTLSQPDSFGLGFQAAHQSTPAPARLRGSQSVV